MTLAATRVGAQDRLFFDMREVDVADRFGAPLGAVPHEVQGELAGAGRYLVRFNAALDILTGTRIPLPGGWVLDVDPTQPRAFMYDGTTVSIVDIPTATAAPLATARHPYPRGFVSASYAAATDELFVRRRGADDHSAEIAVVRVATGEILRVLPQVFENDWDWHVTGDGRFVVVMTFGDYLGGPYERGVHIIDAGSGIRQAVFPLADVANIVDDQRFGRTYVLGRGGLVALDRQLTPMASVPLPPQCYPRMAFSPHADRLYVVSTEPPGLQSNGRYLLTSFDVAAGRVDAAADVTAAVGIVPTSSACNSPAVVVHTAPPAPTALSVSLSGRDVTLDWHAVGAASFVIDVGLAPGRTDLTLPLGAAFTATIPGAPPGVYYARVRGQSLLGFSRPSNEVSIVVP